MDSETVSYIKFLLEHEDIRALMNTHKIAVEEIIKQIRVAETEDDLFIYEGSFYCRHCGEEIIEPERLFTAIVIETWGEGGGLITHAETDVVATPSTDYDVLCGNCGFELFIRGDEITTRILCIMFVYNFLWRTGRA